MAGVAGHHETVDIFLLLHVEDAAHSLVVHHEGIFPVHGEALGRTLDFDVFGSPVREIANEFMLERWIVAFGSLCHCAPADKDGCQQKYVSEDVHNTNIPFCFNIQVCFIILREEFLNMGWFYINSIRVGNGYDVHALEEGLPMWLCGVNIPSSKGFVAHSDGDVAIHALCDALLGAAALGDIGQHFPDSDDRYKGIDSKVLLAEVVKLLKDKKLNNGERYDIENVDITIALQEPKLRPFIDKMRETLAKILVIDKSQVSVKATTTERMGFVGRGEGCEVWATATLMTKSSKSIFFWT